MTTLTFTPEAWRSTRRRNLVRHFFEMVLAMIVGMAVLGAAVRLVCAAFGYSEFFQHAGLRAPVMATNMTIGMAVWIGTEATAGLPSAKWAPPCSFPSLS